MVENEKHFGTTDELIEFFDQNDIGDLVAGSAEVHFDVDLQRRPHFVKLDQDLADRISELSKTEHVSTGTIVNSWVRERLAGHSPKS